MGIARAVGMRRSHLVQAYLAEGPGIQRRRGRGGHAAGHRGGVPDGRRAQQRLRRGLGLHVRPPRRTAQRRRGGGARHRADLHHRGDLLPPGERAQHRGGDPGHPRGIDPGAAAGLDLGPRDYAAGPRPALDDAAHAGRRGAAGRGAAGARPRAAGRLALHAGLATDAPPPGMVADLHAGGRLHDHRAQRRRLGLRLPGRPDAGPAGAAADGAALRRGGDRRAGAACVVGEAGAAGPGPPPLGGADRWGLAAATAGAPLSDAGPDRAHDHQRGRAVLLVRRQLVPRGHPRRQRRGRPGAVLPLRRGDGDGRRGPGDREPGRLRAAAAGAGGVDRAAAAGRADGGRLSRERRRSAPA